MPLIDAHTARCFAESWIDAWNRRDLDAVLSHYAEDFGKFQGSCRLGG